MFRIILLPLILLLLSSYTLSQSEDSNSPSGNLTVDQLRQIMPTLSSTKANEYISFLNDAMTSADINTCCRKSAFLAQLAHESGDLKWYVASFKYMFYDSLRWEELASGEAYEGRSDLGNTQPGDGVRYKGRGPIQVSTVGETI